MRVLLVHGGSCESEVRQTRLLLEAQDCQVVILDTDPAVNDDDRQKSITSLADKCDVVVLMVDASLPLIEAQISILAAKAKGKKIVGIQLSGAGIAGVFEKFGSALIPFVQEKIVATVCGDYVEWANEKGELRPEPDTERHVCKKRKANAAA
jgi:hypothetical protein